MARDRVAAARAAELIVEMYKTARPSRAVGSTANAAPARPAPTDPAAQLVNPAVQISQAFYSIMYYDTYQRTIEHILILLAMAAVLFAASALFIRRQRYASL